MPIPYPQAARFFRGRTVRMVIDDPDRTTFIGTLHPAPHDGKEHVELRTRTGRVTLDVDDIRTLTPHRRQP